MPVFWKNPLSASWKGLKVSTRVDTFALFYDADRLIPQ